MSPGSNPTQINRSFAWTYPGCPLRVILSLRLVERLRAQILQPNAAPARNRQAGGLLLGRKKSRPGVTEVVDFVPIPASQDPLSSPFNLTAEWLDEVARHCSPQVKIVGYYRTSFDNSISLSTDDLKLIQERFTDSDSVFLIVASGLWGTTAGFFCWHDSAIMMNPRFTFPLSAAELASGRWPTQNSHGLRERLANFSETLLHPHLPHPDLTKLHWKKPATIVLGIALFVGTGLTLRSIVGSHSSVAASVAASPPPVTLHVERIGTAFVLTWNTTAPELVTALGGELEIHEGTQPVSLLNLTPEQLRLGTVAYGSYPYSDRAEFRLRVIKANGIPGPESTALPLQSSLTADNRIPTGEPTVPSPKTDSARLPETHALTPPRALPPPPPTVTESPRWPEPAQRPPAQRVSQQPVPAQHPPAPQPAQQVRQAKAPHAPAPQSTAQRGPSPQVSQPQTLQQHPAAQHPPAQQAVAQLAPAQPAPAQHVSQQPPVTQHPPTQSVPAPQATAQTMPPLAAPPPPAEPQRRAFVPPAPKPDQNLTTARTTVLEPPALGRFRTPSGTLGWELATSVPQIPTAPPSTTTRESSEVQSAPPPPPVRQPVLPESTVGLVTITSEPSGASVLINDLPAGTTPVSFQMSPLGLGFTVKINKPGYATWSVQSVATDQPTSLHARLRPR